eukprot:CFRG3760T1
MIPSCIPIVLKKGSCLVGVFVLMIVLWRMTPYPDGSGETTVEQLVAINMFAEGFDYWKNFVENEPIIFNREAYNLDNLPGEAKEDIVHVVVCSDKKTLGGMIAVVTSAMFHTPGHLFFHLVLLPEDIAQVRDWLLHYYPKQITMEIIEFKPELVKGNVRVRGARKELGSPLNFARFWLPDLLPTITHERVLYLDDDTLVRGDLREMRDLFLEPGHVAAFVPDTVNKMKMFLNFDNPRVVGTKIDKNAFAFNAGVFVADIQAWRRSNITAKLLYWSRMNVQEDVYGGRGGGGASQPPMLIVFNGLATDLPEIWHMRHFGWKKALSYNSTQVHSGRLLHFNGGDKPWYRRSKWFLLWYKYFLPDPSDKWKITERARKHVVADITDIVRQEIARVNKEIKGIAGADISTYSIPPKRPGSSRVHNAFLDDTFKKCMLPELYDAAFTTLIGRTTAPVTFNSHSNT